MEIVNTGPGAGARVEFSVYRSRIIASNLKVLWQANCKIGVMTFVLLVIFLVVLDIERFSAGS